MVTWTTNELKAFFPFSCYEILFRACFSSSGRTYWGKSWSLIAKAAKVTF